MLIPAVLPYLYSHELTVLLCVYRAGIDGGGVFKEFFTSLCKEVFDTDRGLWLANKKNELYPNPHAYATERKWRFPKERSKSKYSLCMPSAHSLNWYRFVGRILGKALYQGILVDVAFAGFFLAKVRSSFVVEYKGCVGNLEE